MDQSTVTLSTMATVTRAETFKAWETAASSYKDKERKAVADARVFTYSDEYRLTTDRVRDGLKLQFKEAKKLVDRYIAALTQHSYDVRVVARELPFIAPNHPFSQFLAKFARALAINSDENAAVASEIFSLALARAFEELRLEETLETVIEMALVDGVAYMKDGVRVEGEGPGERVKVTLDAVQRTDVTHDPGVFTHGRACWWMHSVRCTADQARAYLGDKFDAKATKSDVQAVLPVTADKGDTKSRPYLVTEVWWEEGGAWWRCFWANQTTTDPVKSPLPHGAHPFHALVGVTRVDGADGLSFALDIVYDAAVAKNKSVSAAVNNLELTGNNKNLINPNKVRNPAALADPAVTNVLLEDGATFEEAVLQLRGSDISASFSVVRDMLSEELADTADMRSGEPEGAGLIPQLGRVDTLKKRVKRLLRGVGINVAHELTLVDQLTSYELTAQAPGLPSFVQFNPLLFKDIFAPGTGRLDVVVEDVELWPTDPVEQSKIRREEIAAAVDVSGRLGLPLSAVLSQARFPGKREFVRMVYANERAAAEAAAAAKARGEPDQATREILAQSEKQRRDAAYEVLKKTLQRVSDANPPLGAALELAGVTDGIFRSRDMMADEFAELVGLMEVMQLQVIADPLLDVLIKAGRVRLRVLELRQLAAQGAPLEAGLADQVEDQAEGETVEDDDEEPATS